MTLDALYRKMGRATENGVMEPDEIMSNIHAYNEAWATMWAAAERLVEASDALTVAGGNLSGDLAVDVLVDLLAARWRPDALGMYGAKPKRGIPAKLRILVFERDAYRCVVCGDWHALCCDHIVPEARGGLTVPSNLQTLCKPCNTSKATKDDDAWKQRRRAELGL